MLEQYCCQTDRSQIENGARLYQTQTRRMKDLRVKRYPSVPTRFDRVRPWLSPLGLDKGTNMIGARKEDAPQGFV